MQAMVDCVLEFSAGTNDSMSNLVCSVEIEL